MVFSKFLWVFGIDLFVGRDTHKGKAAYTQIALRGGVVVVVGM